MKDISKVSELLFDKIRSRFDGVSLGSENGKATSDPRNARFFNFDYKSGGENFGNVTISIIDGQSLKIYFNKEIANKLDKEQQDEWFEFLRGMRKFARKNMLTFDTRDIARSSLEIRDIMQQSIDNNQDVSDLDIQESKMYGTKRKSYDHVGETRLIIRHADMVDEEKRGARTRNIEAVFVETAEGERYKLQTTNLHGARAIGQHIAQGGVISDDRTQNIYDMVTEMQQLGKFLRATRNTEAFEDVDIPHMVEAARARYTEVQRGLKTMRGPNGYSKFWDNFMAPESVEIDDEAKLKERFTKKFLDQRIEEALPFVYKAFHKMNERNLTQETESAIDDWASSIPVPGEQVAIREGTWHLPEKDEDVEEFKKIMSKPIEFGVDSDNATNAIGGIFGDDELYDDLYAASEIQGPDADARPVIVKWFTGVWKDVTSGVAGVSDVHKEMLDKIGTHLRSWKPDAEPAPAEEPAPDAEEPAADAEPAAEGHSPHKKGTKKYKKHMAAMHAEESEPEEISIPKLTSAEATIASNSLPELPNDSDEDLEEEAPDIPLDDLKKLVTRIGQHTISNLPRAHKVETTDPDILDFKKLAGL